MMLFENIDLHCVRRRLTQHRVRCVSMLLSSTFVLASLAAQTTPMPRSDPQHMIDIENRLNNLTDSLAQTQKALRQSLVEIDRLRAELDALRKTGMAVPPTSESVASTSTATEMDALHEQQDIQQAEIKQHEQTKVETASKYNLRVTGLALFSAFSNAGVVDNAELPSLALPRNPGSAHGSVGATLRQTVFGVVATGPVIGGAQSSVILNADFFGGATSNALGYTSLAGYVRLRDAQLSLDWSKTTLEVGYTGPLISPLSPTSFATIAEPALSGSGNLWTWSPQIRLEQRVPITAGRGLSGEIGLIFPPSPAYTSIQLDSPVEASRRPGIEGRISYQANASTPSPHRLAVGISGYTANQFYNSTTTVHSWAVASDWQIPLSHRVDLSGEIYRGRSLGGLGGGLYKDVLTGTSPVTGQAVMVGVDTVGGWAQLKLSMNSHLEANGMFGLDDAFASSFRSVLLPSGSGALTQSARNSSVTGNLIFRPRSSLIFSPEYRRILTWRITGAPYSANIFTLSAGYQF